MIFTLGKVNATHKALLGFLTQTLGLSEEPIIILPDTLQYLVIYVCITLPLVLHWYSIMAFKLFKLLRRLWFFLVPASVPQANPAPAGYDPRFVVANDYEEGRPFVGQSESIKPGAPFFTAPWPRAQVLVGSRSEAGDFVVIGTGYRHKDYLITAYHNLVQTDDCYIAVPGKDKYYRIPSDSECFFDDLGIVKVPPKTWSELSTISAKHHTFRMPISVLANHPTMGASSGMLSHSRLSGVVEFTGSTTAGSSGCPYMFGVHVAGVHTTGSLGNGPNTGISAAVIEGVISYLERGNPEFSARGPEDWRKSETSETVEVGDRNFTFAGNRVYVSDEAPVRSSLRDPQFQDDYEEEDNWYSEDPDVDYTEKLVWKAGKKRPKKYKGDVMDFYRDDALMECIRQLGNKIEDLSASKTNVTPPAPVSAQEDSAQNPFLGERASGSTNATSISTKDMQRLLKEMTESSERLKRLENSLQRSNNMNSPHFAGWRNSKPKNTPSGYNRQNEPTTSSGGKRPTQPRRSLSSSRAGVSS